MRTNAVLRVRLLSRAVTVAIGIASCGASGCAGPQGAAAAASTDRFAQPAEPAVEDVQAMKTADYRCEADGLDTIVLHRDGKEYERFGRGGTSVVWMGVSMDYAMEGGFPTRTCVVRVQGEEVYRQEVPYPARYYPDEGSATVPSPLTASADATGWELAFQGASVARIELSDAPSGYEYRGAIGRVAKGEIKCRPRQRKQVGVLDGLPVYHVRLLCYAATRDVGYRLPIGRVELPFHQVEVAGKPRVLSAVEEERAIAQTEVARARAEQAEAEERERRRREEEALIAGMLLAGAYHLPGVGFNRNFDQEGCQ